MFVYLFVVACHREMRILVYDVVLIMLYHKPSAYNEKYSHDVHGTEAKTVTLQLMIIKLL